MNVLAVAHDLPPILAPQTIQIGRLLYHVSDSCRLHVATTHYRTPLSCKPYSDWKKKAADFVSVPSIHNNRLLGVWMRLFPLLFRIPEPSRLDIGAMERAIHLHWGDKSFDRIVTFAYPFSSHLLGIALKRHFRAPWTAHFSDPWARNPLMNFGPISRQLNKRWEGDVIEAADDLIFVSEETRNFYARGYPDYAAKMRVLEHSFDPTLYPAEGPAAPGKRHCVVRFLGNLYGGRSFDVFFKALSLLPPAQKSILKVELVLSYKRPLKKLVRDYQLESIVSLYPPVDYLESLRLMRTADVLVTIDTPLPAPFKENLFFPSKLVDYMGAGRPILALAGEGSTRRIINKYGGWVARPDEPQDAAQVMNGILDDWRQGRLEQFKPPVDVYNDYSVATKTRQFLEYLR